MHVLIIEDDAKTADFVAGAFRQSGYVCTICADGLEGSAAALANDYDAAVSFPREARWTRGSRD